MDTKQTKELMNPFLKALYTVFLAILIALFFGLGVAAFYTSPKSPEYPVVLEQKTTPSELESTEVKQIREDYDKTQKDYMKKIAVYNRNVSIITLALAVLALVVGLLFINNIHLISDALLLGGIFTLMYSIGRGFATEDAKYRFVIVSVGLAITLALGYIKFIKPRESK